MRIWSLHPKYLDGKGLVALWRETLLAKKVLEGKTKGYKNHPQLIRFKELKNPLNAINKYLEHISIEAEERNYNFDSRKFTRIKQEERIIVTSGQIHFEFAHLLKKLQKRDKVLFKKISQLKKIESHPLFSRQRGGIAPWEKL